MPCVLRAASLFSAVFEHFNSCHVAAYAFAEVAGAVAAYFTLIINANRVGAVVADYVVDAVAQELNSSAVSEFSCFLKQNVRSVVSGHKRSSQAYFALGEIKAVPHSIAFLLRLITKKQQTSETGATCG